MSQCVCVCVCVVVVILGRRHAFAGIAWAGGERGISRFFVDYCRAAAVIIFYVTFTQMVFARAISFETGTANKLLLLLVFRARRGLPPFSLRTAICLPHSGRRLMPSVEASPHATDGLRPGL